MEEVEYLCNRIYIMDQGRIIASGSKDEIKAILSSENTVVVKVNNNSNAFMNELFNQPILTNIKADEDKINFTIAKGVNFLPNLLSLCERHNVLLKSFQMEEPTLEDVFYI